MAAAIKEKYSGTRKISKYVLSEVNCSTEPGKAVIKITSKGMVTALRPGYTLVTAYDKGGGLIADCGIEVVEKPYFFDNYYAKNKLPVMTVKGSTISAPFYLNNVFSEGVLYTYKSSKPKVASIDPDGTITAKKTGKTKITVTISNAETGYKSMKISATLKVQLPSISKTTVSLKPGKSQTISIKNATGTVVWSQDGHIEAATITPAAGNATKCKITAGLNGGVTKIQASLEDGNEFECVVVVKQLGNRFYDDVGLQGKYNTSNAKKMISGLNSYRKSNGAAKLKTDAALTVMAAINVRFYEAGLEYPYASGVDHNGLIYVGNLQSPFKSFTGFRDDFVGGENEEASKQMFLRDYKKVGCATFYNADTGRYRTYIVFSY